MIPGDMVHEETGTRNMLVRGKLAVLIVCANELLAQGVYAATFTWTGAASTDWFKTNNWTPSGIPGSNDTVNFSSGTINFPAPVIFGGQFNWSGGTLSGSSLTLTTNGIMNISGSSTKMLSTAITNGGTVNWAGTGSITLYNYGGNTGGLVNQLGALFDVQNDQTIGNGGGSPYFN